MKNRRFAKTLVLCLLALALFLSFGCSRPASNGKDKVIKIGAILPLTGSNAVYGQNDKMGIDLAIEKVNAQGGINGKKIEVIYEDNQGEAKMAVSAMQKLMQEGVFIVIDNAMSSITLSMVPIAKDNKMIIISTGATNPKLSGISPYFFRIWNSDGEEAVFTAKYCREKLGMKDIVIMYINNDYGKGLADAFEKSFNNLGGKVLSKIDFEQKSKDFRNVIAKLTKYPTDNIYLVGYASQTGLIANQIKEQKMNKAIVGSVAMEDTKFIELAGKASEGIMYPYSKTPSGKQVEEFNKLFEQKYGKKPEILCDKGFDATNLAIMALKNGASNAEKVREFFLNMKEYEGASGMIKFDKNGEVHQPMVMKIIKNGKFEVLGKP